MNIEQSNLRTDIIDFVSSHLVTKNSLPKKFNVENKEININGEMDYLLRNKLLITEAGFLVSNVKKVMSCKVTDAPGQVICLKTNNLIDVGTSETKIYYPNEIVRVAVRATDDSLKLIGFDYLLEKTLIEVKQTNDEFLFSVTPGVFLKAFISSDDTSKQHKHYFASGDFTSVSNDGSRGIVINKVLPSANKSERIYYEAMREKNLPLFFSKGEELEAAESWAHSEVSDRDLTTIPFISIDSKNARDLDDLVFVEKKHNGWHVVVAISDVSSIVKKGGLLDTTAKERGGSLYVGGRCLPMLPDIISYIACSMQPGVDRNAIIAEMNISENGELVSYRFINGLVQSHHRFSYSEAQFVFDNRGRNVLSDTKAAPHLNTIYELYDLQATLIKNKEIRGGATLYPRGKYPQFNKEGSFDGFFKPNLCTANSVVEEVMNLANIAAAKYLKMDNRPTVYRYHPPVSHNDIVPINKVISNLGIKKLFSPLSMLKIINARNEVEDKEPKSVGVFDSLLSEISVSSKYSSSESSHYGLAVDSYTHFTSPIRRYTDIVVHRLIKAKIKRDHGVFINGAEEYTKNEIESVIEDLNNGHEKNKSVSNLIIGRFSCNYWEMQKDRIFEAKLATIGKNCYYLYVGDSSVTCVISFDDYKKRTDEPLDYFDVIFVKLKKTDYKNGKVFFELANA